MHSQGCVDGGQAVFKDDSERPSHPPAVLPQVEEAVSRLISMVFTIERKVIFTYSRIELKLHKV